MRISDWSSDVCSSDLVPHAVERLGQLAPQRGHVVAQQRAGEHQRVAVAAHAGATSRHPRSTGPCAARRRPVRSTCAAAPGRTAGGTSARTTRPRPSRRTRSEEHTSELPSLMRISYAVFCLKKKTQNQKDTYTT